MVNAEALNTVLVAIDRSALSLAEMDFLPLLSLRSDSVVILAHVMSDPATTLGDVDHPHETSDDQYRTIEEQLQILGDRLACNYEIEIVQGDPANELVGLAKRYRAELIIIGSRGLTGMDRIIQGSVSTQVVEDAPCSVLVIKQ